MRDVRRRDRAGAHSPGYLRRHRPKGRRGRQRPRRARRASSQLAAGGRRRASRGRMRGAGRELLRVAEVAAAGAAKV